MPADPDARHQANVERFDALLGVIARRRARATFAPIALALVAIGVSVGGVATRSTFFAAEHASQVARLALAIFYCSVPAAVMFTLHTARSARIAGIEALRQGGGAALAPMIDHARQTERRGAAWVRLGFATFFAWMHLCLVGWLRPDASTLGGAAVVAAATIMFGAIGASFVSGTLARGRDLAPLARPVSWGSAVILIGLVLAFWRTPAPEGHLGALLVWLGFMQKTRATLFRTLLEERAVLDAPPAAS